MRTAKEYEDDVTNLLDVFFSAQHAVEIRTRKGLRYRSERGFRCYSPMIDITVGPFSETRGISLWADYDNLVLFSRNFINRIIEQFRINYQNFAEGYFGFEERTLPRGHRDFLSRNQNANWNARCFLALEVEDSGSRKHLLGDMINASISGRIAVLIGCNEDRYEAFMKLLEYIAYTSEAGKIKFTTRNILVLKPDQFEKALIDSLEEGP